MLHSLCLRNAGPAPRLEIELKPRTNILTGDNGLGKTFILDVAWWALTGSWARELVLPHAHPSKGSISFSYTKKTSGLYSYDSTFDRATEQWTVKRGRPAVPGLVLYAQVDGGFSVWDPVRNYWKKDAPDRPPAYLFKAHEVWQGNALCEGLVRDWASWQMEQGATFKILKDVLSILSPSPQELIEPGQLRKLTLDDPKRYPTLKMPYNQEISVTHASAGMRRILALAYLLVWAWREHLAAVELRGERPTREIIFLIDEIESHLHPQWQRRIAPALLKVMQALIGEHPVKVQLISTTHSPIILTSIEPEFDQDQDGLFLLDMDSNHQVTLNHQSWSKQGDVVNWLVSETFGLKQGRSLEAERAIEAANASMRGEQSVNFSSVQEIDRELRRVLAGHDTFWPRWSLWFEKHNGEHA